MQRILVAPSKPHTSNYRLVVFMIASCLICTTYILASFFIVPKTKTRTYSSITMSSLLQVNLPSPTSLEHVVFGIASNAKSWLARKSHVSLWWRPHHYMRGCVFLEMAPPNSTLLDDHENLYSDDDLPPICISEDKLAFRYTYRNGLRSAICVARVVLETVGLNHSGVRWFVFGDDDTLFFRDNLVKTLSKYDHRLWHYIGTNSESYNQNKLFSFDMAFGGAGFAISYPLAKVLAKVFDSCLHRYPHLYGSDSRIHAFLTELGVGLTHEPGFHQMDIRGAMLGSLASHPLRPLVSLHHWEAMDPIFPKMTPIEALQHLFKAVRYDSQRIMQQSVCYDRWFSWTISVSWGYAVRVFPYHVFLPDAVRTQETYLPWNKRGANNNLYIVDTLGNHPDPCRRPVVFFLHNVMSSDGTDDVPKSTYRMMTSENCYFDKGSPRKLEEIRVFSHKLDLDFKQLQAPRRHCCDVLPSNVSTAMEIAVRECGEEELIYMH